MLSADLTMGNTLCNNTITEPEALRWETGAVGRGSHPERVADLALTPTSWQEQGEYENEDPARTQKPLTNENENENADALSR